MFSSQESKKLATLPTDTTHYLIPFSDVATKFMDVIEFEQLSGVIFPQTDQLKLLFSCCKTIENSFCS